MDVDFKSLAKTFQNHEEKLLFMLVKESIIKRLNCSDDVNRIVAR